MHLPDWVADEYLEQLTGQMKITVRDKRTRTKKVIYVKSYSRNEALDLTVPKLRDCHAGLFALQNLIAPAIYRDLSKLAQAVQQGRAPETLATRVRRLRSPGLT